MKNGVGLNQEIQSKLMIQVLAMGVSLSYA